MCICEFTHKNSLHNTRFQAHCNVCSNTRDGLCVLRANKRKAKWTLNTRLYKSDLILYDYREVIQSHFHSLYFSSFNYICHSAFRRVATTSTYVCGVYSFTIRMNWILAKVNHLNDFVPFALSVAYNCNSSKFNIICCNTQLGWFSKNKYSALKFQVL